MGVRVGGIRGVAPGGGRRGIEKDSQRAGGVGLSMSAGRIRAVVVLLACWELILWVSCSASTSRCSH